MLFSVPNTKLPNKADYEPVDNDETNSKTRVLGCLGASSFLLLVSAVMLGGMVIVLAQQHDGNLLPSATASAKYNSNTILPQLSLIGNVRDGGDKDADAGDLVQELDQSVIHSNRVSNMHLKHVQEWPELSLDLEHELETVNGRSTERTSLTVSWTVGLDDSSREDGRSGVLNDTDDVLVLRCGDLDIPNEMHVKEAATLAQVKAAAMQQKKSKKNGRSLLGDWSYHNDDDDQERWHIIRRPRRHRRTSQWHDWRTSDAEWNSGNEEWHNNRDREEWKYSSSSSKEEEWSSDENEWHIADVPSEILREPYCQFALFHKIQPLEYVVVSESAIIHFGNVHK